MQRHAPPVLGKVGVTGGDKGYKRAAMQQGAGAVAAGALPPVQRSRVPSSLSASTCNVRQQADSPLTCSSSWSPGPGGALLRAARPDCADGRASCLGRCAARAGGRGDAQRGGARGGHCQEGALRVAEAGGCMCELARVTSGPSWGCGFKRRSSAATQAGGAPHWPAVPTAVALAPPSSGGRGHLRAGAAHVAHRGV